MKLIIPDRRSMMKTSNMDPLDYYYKPLVRYFYRKRLRMCLHLMGNGKRGRILEIGYGSGIFLSSLHQASKHLFGIDLHDGNFKVQKFFKGSGINLHLTSGDIRWMPYADNSFDCIVAISILEHMEGSSKMANLRSAIEEIYRVLAKGKHLYIGIPVKSKLMDLAFYYLFNFNELHGLSHLSILDEVKRKFRIVNINSFPSALPFKLYLCIDAVKEE